MGETPQQSSRLARAGLRLFRHDAVEVVRDPQQATRVLADAERMTRKRRGKLRGLWDSLTTLLRLLRAHLAGTYRVPLKTIVLVFAGLLYFVCPLDFVPDFVFALGLIDDVAVLALMLKLVRGELDAFRAWEQSQSVPPV